MHIRILYFLGLVNSFYKIRIMFGDVMVRCAGRPLTVAFIFARKKISEEIFMNKCPKCGAICNNFARFCSNCGCFLELTASTSARVKTETSYSGCGSINCRKPLQPTQGLEYDFVEDEDVNDFKDEYYVAGLGSANETDIVIPEVFKGLPVTIIGGSAFFECDSITSVTIPESVTKIVECAFADCIRLNNVTILKGVVSIGYSSFENCTSLTSITLPDSVKMIDGKAFYNCENLENVTIPESVTEIGESAFDGCKKAISFVDGVGYIDKWVVSCDKKITVAKIKNGTKFIADRVFMECTNLTSITIPESVIAIGRRAFYECSSLTNIIIPNSINTIRRSTFFYCGGLSSVTIPKSVITIERSAFDSCQNLTNITFNGTKEQWNTIDKSSAWNANAGNYTVHCTDGDIARADDK